MRKQAKIIYKHLPRHFRVAVLKMYEYFFFLKTKKRAGSICEKMPALIYGRKPRILFYHISGLSFGGTEKFLQIIAKYLPKEKYDVYYMYSSKPRKTSGNIPLDGRLSYLEGSGITTIPFTYEKLEEVYPYFVKDMSPTLPEVIDLHNIDLIFTAGSGYTEFPVNIVRNLPIIMINIFGSPSIQNNFKKHLCISHEVAAKISPVVNANKIDVMYIQSESLSDEKRAAYEASGMATRKKFGITDNDFVFGRIGRADDGIFDPIAISAFKTIVANDPSAHYIIMSPPPAAIKMVAEENIPNVHFINPSAEESDVWAFHFSIDALAHFRFDGESFGLNIAEAMLAGKPVLTHKSHIWNAHLEYLEPSFSFVAERNDISGYTKNMGHIIEAKKTGTINAMCNNARAKSESLFLMEKNIGKIAEIIDLSL